MFWYQLTPEAKAMIWIRLQESGLSEKLTRDDVEKMDFIPSAIQGCASHVAACQYGSFTILVWLNYLEGKKSFEVIRVKSVFWSENERQNINTAL